jgi:hypothetical protein
MKLTKSLFVEFVNSPKLAWFHVNDKATYERIQEAAYGTMDGVAIGQSVEDMVMALYDTTQIRVIDTTNMRSNWHGTYHQRTIQIMHQPSEVVYQPAFLVADVFVKCDFLVANAAGQYDLVEVKAKNSIRKKTKDEPLLDELIADVSIQHWVLKQALGDRYSGRCFIAHLNKEYIRHGEIDPRALIITEDVTSELLEDANIMMILKTMREALTLPLEQFNARYPYDGTDYMSYFWTPPPKKSLRSIPRLSAEKKCELYDQGKVALEDFDQLDIEFLKSSKGEPTLASTYVEMWQQAEMLTDRDTLRQELSTLRFPLYFYDYETINGPIPVMQGTSPRQQVVVQYSLHKLQADGTMTHHEALIEPGAQTNEHLLQQMIDDMDGAQEGTFIVRYKGFESSRNTERWTMFPQYQEALERINARTFDLMEMFSRQIVFHRDFEWSSSIKKVLPVLTDISYDWLEVSNGAIAMELLMQLVLGRFSGMQLDIVRTNLLTYCKQDTWAMVRLWQELVKLIS